MSETGKTVEALEEGEPLAMFQNLGLALRVSRGLQGWSQVELARRAGMTKGQVSRIESGGELPRLVRLARLLRELKTTPYLFFYTLHFLDELKAGRVLPLAPSNEASLTPAEHAAFSRLVEDLFALQRAIVEGRIASVPT